tara:strand:- start:533 stop:988 length:456 start_codon:yes stop_codon:yes gene_type:complete
MDKKQLTLAKTPSQLRQRSTLDCVPTCIAMALGVPQALVDKHATGLDVEGGYNRRDTLCVLTRLGVHGTAWHTTGGQTLPAGHYLFGTVYAKQNLALAYHCVLLVVRAPFGNAAIYDPRYGLAAPVSSSLELPPAIELLKLDDFADLGDWS